MQDEREWPTFEHELRLWQQGVRHIAGVDEAGRGALAGPVVAAAVIAPPDSAREGIWARVCDSKRLVAHQREQLAAEIQEAALAWAIGTASPQVIDRINIAAATRQAMQMAIAALHPVPEFLLLDWVRLPQLNIRQQSQAKADLTIISVAAASILAKVHRDALLVALDQRYPMYGFAAHKGYGTAAHRAAIEQFGPCVEHRFTFAPVARQQTLFTAVEAEESG
jgi:ribonuclease HII